MIHARTLAVLALCAATPAPAGEPIEGRASVIDGDTVEIHGTRVRLQGIDAPERGQSCSRADGTPYRCGTEAANALDRLIADRPVRCEDHGTDRYGRTLGLCRVAGVDLGAAMVAAGQAVAYRRYALDYVAQEAQAQAARAGLWSGTFEQPEAYRHTRHPRRTER